MALIACQECSAEISDKAGSCPKCGYPVGSAVTTTPPSRSAHGGGGGVDLDAITGKGVDILFLVIFTVGAFKTLGSGGGDAANAMGIAFVIGILWMLTRIFRKA